MVIPRVVSYLPSDLPFFPLAQEEAPVEELEVVQTGA
jgi:hypothetical protein|tara:strand:- start:93 stop:203 length:111 start_codon:yes stop_codon:yes gene_type:complete